MWKTIRTKLTFANVGVVALAFVVLGGGAYAATQLPPNSVGTAQLKNHAVTGSKLSKKAVRELLKAAKRFQPVIHDPAGPTGPQGAHGPQGATGPSGPAGAPGATIPVGVTLRGAAGTTSSSSASAGGATATGVSFGGFATPSRPVAHVVPEGGGPTASCPGTAAAPEAASGNLCVYLSEITPDEVGQVIVVDPGATEFSGTNYNQATEEAATLGDGKVATFGFHLIFSNPGPLNGAQLRGTWAVTG